MTKFKNPFTEQLIEDRAIELFQEQGYEYLCGDKINPNSNGDSLRKDFDIAYYLPILRDCLSRINDSIPSDIIEEAITEIIKPKYTSLIEENKRVFQLITEGVKVPYKDKTYTVKIIDFNNVDNNSFVVSNQLILKEHNNHRRPDVLIYLNGLPISMIEFKNPANEHADLQGAFRQLETYKREFPQAFYFNQINIISDGYFSRVGSISSGYDRFNPWRAEDSYDLKFEIEDIIKDLFKKEKLLNYIKNFITFVNFSGKNIKISAGYHQVRGVNNSLVAIKKAIGVDRKGGIVWHSTGSGKSFSMMFLAGLIEKDIDLKNPTILVITDRIALDSQLYKTFSKGKMILASTPVSIEKSSELKTKLEGIQSGGIYFSTLQKFGIKKKIKNELSFQELSSRDNIIIIVDEAHRSHNGIEDGSARYLRDAFPNATFIGFTGTPIEKGHNDTRAIFGEDNDIYDMRQSILDGATVPIHYEARLAQVKLNTEKVEEINKLFETIEDKTDIEYAENLKSRHATLEAILGSRQRLELLASDITKHFSLRKEALPFSKAMIVCSTRNIAVKLYDQLITLNPSWHNDDINEGRIKVVLSSSATDTENLSKHKTSNDDKKIIASRIETENDELDFIIVCDMWLTGFDAPPVNTMYFDKLLKEHNLIQAIARANRVYKEKPDGLIVDYIGILRYLKEALKIYSPKDREYIGQDIRDDAVNTMMTKTSIIEDLIFGFNYKSDLEKAYKNDDRQILIKLEIDLFNFITNHNDKEILTKFIKFTNDLQKAYSLCATTEEAEGIRYDLVFFGAVKDLLVKNTNISNEKKLKLEDINTQIGQLVSQSVEGVQIIDLLELSSMDRNKIDIFSKEFLDEVRLCKNQNTAAEILKKLLNDEIQSREKTNIIEGKNFRDRLNDIIKKYHDNQIDSTQMTEALISISKFIQDYDKKKNSLGLDEEEIAFYTALSDNKSAVDIMGDKKLKELTKSLVFRCKKSINFNFLEKEDVRAKLRFEVKKLLREFGYPPDMEKLAIDNVVKQSMIIGQNIIL
ncbi:MAG: type I restriction endonuclease subunit R [Alphaproteobacteria bacterium]|nr:type I restriction endonuclease subunit R [Alphaproteobacteria bacterium]